jgi:hypothetical protein
LTSMDDILDKIWKVGEGVFVWVFE